MRSFGAPVGPDVRAQVMEMAERIFDSVEPKREVYGRDFAMDESADEVVVKEVDVKWGDERLRIAKTLPGSRPPFEWLVEITSDVGETDYFKHYLIRANDLVLAQRRDLTPVDKLEAEVIFRDLRAAEGSLKA